MPALQFASRTYEFIADGIITHPGQASRPVAPVSATCDFIVRDSRKTPLSMETDLPFAERLAASAKRANAAGATGCAAALFAAAFAVGGRVEERVATANMHLKAGNATLAKTEYQTMLADPSLPPKVRQMVERKRDEAAAALAKSGLEPGTLSQSTTQQLRTEARWRKAESTGPVVADELKAFGAKANRKGAHALARDVYSAAFALTDRLDNRISSANMRLKAHLGSVHPAFAHPDLTYPPAAT